jgi:hypothetical protein
MLMDATSLCSDALAAAGTALCVAPAIAILDKAIVENAAGTKTLQRSLVDSLSSLVRRPHQFARSPAFLLLWGVYGGTYLAVNVATTACDRKNASKEQRHAVKFFGVSSVNIVLNVSKDRIFTKLFGGGAGDAAAGAGIARSVPMRSLGAFALRDSMTVFATFNVAPALADALIGDAAVMAAAEAAAGASSSATGAAATSIRTAVQLLSPVAMQWLSAPLHLIGLNWYNVPAGSANNATRLAFVQKEYLLTAVARSCRILPAFGIAPLINAPLREYTHSIFSNNSNNDTNTDTVPERRQLSERPQIFMPGMTLLQQRPATTI